MAEADRRIHEVATREKPVLELSGLGLTEVPKSLALLTRLERLNISNNELTVLPDFMGQFEHLRSLAADGNRLKALPDSFVNLTRLVGLDVSSNRLSALPEWIGQLTQLRTLVASHNHLVMLPESTGQLAQLDRLDVSRNHLLKLPESLGQLTRLKMVDAAINRLTAIPDSISRLSQLQFLDIGVNRLTTLPTTLCHVTSLENFYIGENLLTVLPDGIEKLIQLRCLDISYNRLTTLPESLRELSSLNELYLHGNDQLGIPSEVLGPLPLKQSKERPAAGAISILDYYFRTRRASRPLNEAKLILVGRGGVGKTSLVNRLVHRKFNPKEQKTDGIGITGWPIVLGQEKVRLNVWDFGGQEIMHATHQFFLTRRSLYLLVLNAREGEQDANVEYWLKIIEGFGAESPVIVVVNKIQEHTFDLNRRGLREKYPAIRDFIQTDCETGMGLEELRKSVERETNRLENLRDPFPAAWFKVKDELARMKQNYMSFDQYREFCKARGVNEGQSQESLVSVLHRLGIVLNFRDDARLCDLNVLKPEWVTKGIYKLLNSEGLAKNGGVLEVSDLSYLLDDKEYPIETHGYLIDLMKKFELCFEFEGSKGERYLIPELLGKEEPQLTEWQSEDVLQFQYHYNILPEGLLPRFIVLTHRMSEGRQRWRTGVVLAFDGNEALVKADVQDRRVFIAVRGDAEGRRRLLAAIRLQFEHIHRSIPKLEAVEKVPVPGSPKAAVAYSHLLKLEGLGIGEFWPEGADNPIHVPDILNGYEAPKDREKKRLEMSGVIAKKEFHFHGKTHVHVEGDDMKQAGGDINEQSITDSTFNNSPAAIRQSLQNSYNTIQRASDQAVKRKLEELHQQVTRLMARLDEKQQAEAKENLEALAKEATKPEPRRKWYDLSAEGLVGAAKTVKELAAPITATVKEIGSLLFPAGSGGPQISDQ